MNENEYTFSPDHTPDPEATPAISGIAPVAPSQRSAWSSVRSFIKETLETIALTLIIFIIIRAGVQNFRIEGYSMEPNFHDGQYLLVNKVEYLVRSPQRGDVIVFMSPQNAQRDFIKRVIALPGETVEIRDGRVVVDGKELSQNYKINPASYNYSPTKVGAEELFVLGDNRNHSSDSHSWGMLPREHIIGKAWISYWPPQEWGFIQTPSFADNEPAKGSPTPLPAVPTRPKQAYP